MITAAEREGVCDVCPLFSVGLVRMAVGLAEQPLMSSAKTASADNADNFIGKNGSGLDCMKK